jgi:D-3-phosphoglycerate dehydrogenase
MRFNHEAIGRMKTGSLSRRRVVVAEPFAESGLAVLRAAGIEVDSVVGKGRDALIAALEGADGLIVRSETQVDRALLGKGRDLAVVARAGVGVDSIDIPAATDAGIVVLNVPAANTLAATEQTFALMLALVRHIVPASNALRDGIWDRKPYIGTELAGKTLGIVGLGRIGGNVAVRAKAFGMKLLATDPFITKARADSFSATLVPLEELLAKCDIVTFHTPLNAQTRGMVDGNKLALLQPHAYVINCARGGIIEETALLNALNNNILAGAAIDVVAVEPPPADGPGAALHRHPKVVASPHLGGSTREALERIAIELARDVASVLAGHPASGAVNAPQIVDERMEPFVDVAYRLGVMLPQLSRGSGSSQLTLTVEGELAGMNPDPLVTAMLAGYLGTTTDRRVSVVNAKQLADELGVRVELAENEQADGYASLLRLTCSDVCLAATATTSGTRVVEVDGYKVDASLSGAMIFTEHRDVPGQIGRVGTVLGHAEINISAMQVSRESSGGVAVMILNVDRQADGKTLDELRALPGINTVRSLEI